MSETLDISQGWELSWIPEPVLSKWKQVAGDWTIEADKLVANSAGSAMILANLCFEDDYIWECSVCIQTTETAFHVIVGFHESRNAYYRITFHPGESVRADYVFYGATEAELMKSQGPVLRAECNYQIQVFFGSEVEIRLDGECVGVFENHWLCGHMAGFQVHHGMVSIDQVRMLRTDNRTTLFEDDFSSNTLVRTIPVTYEELVSDHWIPAVVPGTVQTALLESGEIKDPYWGDNAPQQKWIDRQRWLYRCVFVVPETWSEKEIEIVFHGIDYHGYIWLNGELLAYHEGMHRKCILNISDKVARKEENELIVCLLPCLSPPHSNVKPYILQRWHFNMDILTIGLWQPVELRACDKVQLLDPQVITKRLDGEDAILDVSFTIVSDVEMYPTGPSGKMSVYSSTSEKAVVEIPLVTGYFKGAQRQELSVRVPDAELWWPNGMGKQPLYRLKIEIWTVPENQRNQTPPADSMEVSFGVCIVEMRPTPEGRWKYDWVFTMNNRPFFAKGSNWMPIDQLLRLDKERYEMLLQRAQDCHINILRPWGGGLLETDDFYDICDRLGICVWQEFPLANGLFHKINMDVWRDTVIQNIKRLRNHPSLVLWCGGNEFNPDCSQNKPVIDTLECLCHDLDPSRDFYRASPYGGDNHSYQVNWADDANYTYFTRDLSPAITEFSMASPPKFSSLGKFLPQDEITTWPPRTTDHLDEYKGSVWSSEFREQESAFSTHDAHLPKAFTKMLPFISDCGIPANWDEFIEYAQTAQGALTRFGIDFWRSRWPYCTTTMSWVFNVIWPSSMTWEYVDWFGTPKASYYDHMQAYEPLHVIAVYNEMCTPPGKKFEASLFVVNETVTAYLDATVSVRLYDISLSVLAEAENIYAIEPDTVNRVGFFSWKVPETSKDQVLFLQVDVRDKMSNTVLSRSVYTPRIGTPVMKMPYLKEGPWIADVQHAATSIKVGWETPWQKECTGWSGVVRIMNTGCKPAYRVRLYCPECDHMLRYSTNYIWLEPGETMTVTINSSRERPNRMLCKAWNADEQELFS